MKRITTAFGVCVALFTMNVVYATAYDWVGTSGTEKDWEDSGNWLQNDGNYPGDYAGRTDSATIGAYSNSTICELNVDLPGTISTVTVDADARNLPLTLSILGSGGLTTSGLVTIQADPYGAVDRYARITVATDGSFSPNSMAFIGHTSDTYSHAEAVFDEDVPPNPNDRFPISFEGYVDLDVADNATLSAAAMSVTSTTANVTLQTNASGDMTATAMAITASSADAKLVWSGAGTNDLDIGGTMTLHASDDANHYDAEFELSSGSIEVDDIVCEGGHNASRGNSGLVYLDLDADPTITDDVSVTGEANFEIDDPTTIGDDLIIGSATDYGDVIQSGASSLTVSGDMTVQAGDGANEDSIYQQSAGTLGVNGTVIVEGDPSVDATATIYIAGGTFTPNAMRLYGRNHATEGHAYGYFDVSATVQGTCNGTVDVCMEGGVDIVFANSVTVDARDLGIGNCSGGNSGTVSLSGSGTLSACSVVIKGDSVSGNTTVTASNGAMLLSY